MQTFQQTKFGAGCCLLLWAFSTCMLMLFVGLPLLLCMQAAQWFEVEVSDKPEHNP